MQVEGQHVSGLPDMMATGARVSNAYPTCPVHGDSLPKGRLIPDDVRSSHVNLTKVITMDRGSERKVPHIGTETRSKLLREAAVRNIGQWPGG